MVFRRFAQAAVGLALIVGGASTANFADATTPATDPGAFQSLPPHRQLDTRINVGATGPVAAHGTVALALAGTVPAGAAAVVLNVTVTQPKAPGYITVYGDGPRPLASNLDFAAGQTVPNLVIAPIGAGGIVRLYNGSGGTTQLIADIAGYYLGGGTPAVAGAFQSLPPHRQLDTRINVGATGPVAALGTVALALAGTVPAGAAAVVLNVTVTQPKAPGYITVYGDGPRPLASNLDFAAGQTVPNLVIAPIGAGGIVNLYNGSGGTTQLIADIAGYFMDGPPPPGPVTGVTASGSLAGGITISWTNPPDASYTGVMIRRAVGTTPPATITDGTLISDVAKPGTSFNDTANLTHSTTYSYSLFAHSSVPSYAAKATATTTLGAFSWTPPPYPLIDHHQGHMHSVSCVSTTFCAAVDQEGNALIYNGTSWTLPATIDNPSVVAQLDSVSCVSSSYCVAVDQRGGALTYNGTVWTRLAIDGTTELPSVSCASTTFCAAVDTAGKAFVFSSGAWSGATVDGTTALKSVSCPASGFCVSVDKAGNWLSYNGSSWSAPANIDTQLIGTPTPVPTAVALNSVSCASSSFCVAVDARGSALTYNGTSWTVPNVINGTNPFNSVSCPTISFCAAVDTKGGEFNYNGSTWSTRNIIDGTTELTSVSCLSGTFCVAVDSPIVDNTGNWLKYTGTSWTTPALIDEHLGPLSTVSCASPTFCVAADRRGNWLSYNGSTWTIPLSIAQTSPITSVSCPTTTFCVAVDQRGGALTYNGSTWTVPVTIDTATPSTAAALNSVSCPTTTFCVAVDHSGHAFTYNSGTWSPLAAPVDTTLAPGSPSMGGVSCASATFCVAGDNSGNWLRYNGTTWTAPVNIDSTRALTSVSCPSTTFCAAVDSRGYALTFNGTTWSAPVNIDGSAVIMSVSCQSATFCAAVDAVGKAFTYNGIGWSAPSSIDAPTPLTGVSCPTATFCMVVDQQGYAIKGS
jgi:hypothetical protein